MMQELIEPFSRLLDDCCPPAAVREIERGGAVEPLWAAFADSGFLDALVDEEKGGAGLGLSDVAPLFALLGARAVPLPVGETMIARALLSRAGSEVPAGLITIATGGPVPLAQVARYALIGTRADPVVQEIDAAGETGIDRDLDAWLPFAAPDLRPIGAMLRACQMAGAAERILEMTVGYAGERVQFGKPIGRQQAIQVQLAVLAEQAVAARLAAALGVANGWATSEAAAGIAKHGAGTAAAHATSIAHGVFGAIGISEEHDLQLLTRRLGAWRRADGGERYWAVKVGRERLARPGSAIDYIRQVAAG
jgi:acyl-CoA dehydrogenase